MEASCRRRSISWPRAGRSRQAQCKAQPGGDAYVRLVAAIERRGEICEGVPSCPDGGLVGLGRPEAQRLVSKRSCASRVVGDLVTKATPSAIMVGKAAMPEGRSTSRQK